MAIELFGFSIGRVDKDAKNKESFALPQPEDGALEVGPSGGAYGTYVDLEGAAKSETELINRYRDMSNHPECDQAIDDIINEAIVVNREESPVSLNLEKSNLSDTIKEKIKEEFDEIEIILQQGVPVLIDEAYIEFVNERNCEHFSDTLVKKIKSTTIN